MRRMHEPIVYGPVEERQQRVEIAVYVQQSDRLSVKSKLSPRDDLAELFCRAESPWESNEAPREISHESLALMHRTYDLQLRQTSVHYLLLGKSLRNNAHHFASRFQDGVCQHAHQPYGGSSVDKTDPACGQAPAKGHGGVGICPIQAAA